MAVVKKTKIVNETPKKPSKSPKPKPKHINVKVGAQEIAAFTLTPVKPNKTALAWSLLDNDTKEFVSKIKVSFDSSSPDWLREFERAVLIVSLDEESIKRENGHWRFALNGVIADAVDADPDHDVVVELLHGGTTLVAFVHSTQDTLVKPEEIFFGYVATYTDPETNQMFTYESKDPEIVVGRPR